MGQLLGNEDFIARGADGALQMGFVDSVIAALGTEPEAVMVYEGDFVAGVAAAEAGTVAGVDFDFFPFPSIAGSPPAVMGGGDVAVALTDNPGAGNASPEALTHSRVRAKYWSPTDDRLVRASLSGTIPVAL